MIAEAGVHYSRAADGYMRLFRYQWHHAPSGKSGISVVYCDSEKDFIKLLAWWNRCSRWSYTPLNEIQL